MQRQYATFSEIKLLRRSGRPIVFISFPGRRMPHDTLIVRLHEQLKIETGAQMVFTLRTNVSVPRAKESPFYVQRQRWFTVIDPDTELIDGARAFAAAIASVPRVRARLDGTF